jgi:hypothetical protein
MNRRAAWNLDSMRELLAVVAGSAMLLLGTALVVAMSVAAAAS